MRGRATPSTTGSVDVIRSIINAGHNLPQDTIFWEVMIQRRTSEYHLGDVVIQDDCELLGFQSIKQFLGFIYRPDVRAAF